MKISLFSSHVYELYIVPHYPTLVTFPVIDIVMRERT